MQFIMSISQTSILQTPAVHGTRRISSIGGCIRVCRLGSELSPVFCYGCQLQA